MTPLTMFYSIVTLAISAVSVSHAIKIAFVGDTGLEDRRYHGYGDLTMQMIEDLGADLVVDVGDFEYWGVCTEVFQVTRPLTLASTWGRLVSVPDGAVLKRYRYQDGQHGSIRGWDVGVELSLENDNLIFDKEKVVFEGRERSAPTSISVDRLVMSERAWARHELSLNQTDYCWGEPWDGPYEWSQFIRSHNFDFLGASGNTEVKPIDHGSPEIWASHQRYLHALYMERIYNTQKGSCHGYFNQEAPGSVAEYGERYSCFYQHNGNEDFHFIFLGWWQGSDEHWRDESKEERRQSIDFIEREFNSSRSQNARWRFCIQHMTSAKLSAGDKNRDNMGLSGITDACRRHGAIIVNGHHHLYSRTKLLENVGGTSGAEPISIASKAVTREEGSPIGIVSEGVTMSLTVGMGGYDSSCNGKYANSPWMETCVASLREHRGAVIAEFDEQTPWKGTFKYHNSLNNSAVVDEFQLISRLPGWNVTAPDVSNGATRSRNLNAPRLRK
ncbi:MAG: hypothetical protein SGILL_010798 [Bacillariaceae sp.]